MSAPADLFLTVHPARHRATCVDAASGAAVGAAPTVDASTRRAARSRCACRKSAWDPTGKVVRLAAGVGLWDKANDRYLLPQPTADATHPGGSGTAVNPPAFFNVAFRFDEPMPVDRRPSRHRAEPRVVARPRAGRRARGRRHQPRSARRRRLRQARGRTTNDESGVPQTGPMNRILASHFETAQGADFSVTCFVGDSGTCPGSYQGRLQPYAIYVPHKPVPRRAATA